MYYIDAAIMIRCPHCGAPSWWQWDDGEPQTQEHPGMPGAWIPYTGAPECEHQGLIGDAPDDYLPLIEEAAAPFMERDAELDREYAAALAAQMLEDLPL